MKHRTPRQRTRKELPHSGPMARKGNGQGRGWSRPVRGEGKRSMPPARNPGRSRQTLAPQAMAPQVAAPQVPAQKRLSIHSSHVIVIGKNPVREMLRHCSDRVVNVFSASAPPVPDVPNREPLRASPHESEIWTLLQRANIFTKTVSFEQLTHLAGTDSHQGWLIEARPRQPIALKELLDAHQDAERGVLLLLDGVQDPQNLGSILRAAECFGVGAVVWSRNRGAPVTPSVVKASAGASELVTLVEVGNLNDAIAKCRDAGWWILGAAVDGEATAVQAYEGPRKVALVMGAEGAGLKSLTKRNLDQAVYIPMRGRIDSLNVGQATAVLLSWLSLEKSV